MSLPRAVLCAFLVLWEPANLAIEALTVAAGIAGRGPLAVVELAAHGAVAALTAAAGLSLWNASAHGAALARAGVVASAARTIQSLWWSVLPHDVKPGDHAIIAAIAIANALGWLVYLRREGSEARRR